MAVALSLDTTEVRSAAGRLREGAQHADLLALCRSTAVSAPEVGAPAVAHALRQVLQVCEAAATAIIECLQLGETGAQRIAVGLIAADETAGLAADRLRWSGLRP